MTGLLDLLQNAFSPVTPAAVPTPRLRPSAVGPVASQQADAGQPRIVMTGAAKSNVGGDPISVAPVTPAADGSDPYADVPRLKPRTGIRRFGYNAASGIASVPQDADPITAFADAYLGSSKSEADQTAGERTAQIDEINRKLQLASVQAERERNARLDAAKIDQESSSADLNRAKAKNPGLAGGYQLTPARYYDLVIRREHELNSKYGLNNPGMRPAQREAAQASVNQEMDAFKAELKKAMQGGSAPDGSVAPDGIDPSEAADIALGIGVPPVAKGQPDNSPPAAGKTRGLAPPPEEAPVEKPANTESGAIPDNISGDGSLKDPFRVKNTKDPSLKAKIKVGDHFIYLNPQTGKEEIRIRDR